MRHLYIIFLFVLLAACEHEPLLSEAGVPVRIIPSLDEAAPAGTRVIDQQWQKDEVVGVSIDNSTYNQYKVSATGTTATLTPTATAQTLYYPVNGSSVTFRAFCPYKAPASNVVTYNTFTNQSTSAGMQAVDLVYHSGASGNKNSGAVNMTFQHKFSKVVITATRGANVTNDLSTLAMTLTGMPTSTTFNVSTGALGTASGTGTITPEHYSKAAATTIARAIIAPHAAKTGRTITFAVGSLSYSYTIPNTLAFETGKTYAFNFTLTQTAPVLSGTTITNWSTGTIAWDGTGNSLTAPTEVTHYKEASTGNTIVIKTNHTATPGLTYNSLSWLTQTAFTKTKSTSPYEWTLTYSVAATSANRTGNIEIAVGTMKVVTTVTQSAFSFEPPEGASNCFIVAPGGVISFPLTRPIALGRAASNATFTMQVLWADANCISGTPTVTGTGQTARLNVTATSTTGNALIAVKVSNVIVWSYHIWVTNYNPYSATKTNNGFAFMNRNLGATAAGMGSGIGKGLFYQWGRKDPFPATETQYSGSFTISAAAVTSSTGTIDYAIKNPNVFLKASDASDYDWYYGNGKGVANRNNELWGHSGGKTVYDPCPAGWRVPKNVTMSAAASPWHGFTTSNGGTFSNGYTWGTNAAYSAAGYRFLNDGKLYYVGDYGYYWSASPYSSSTNYASSLHFSNGGVNVHSTSDRAHGFPVRCVQE